MKIVAGRFLAMVIGVVCRLTGIPVPAPPALVGAMLVVSMTLSFLAANRLLAIHDPAAAAQAAPPRREG